MFGEECHRFRRAECHDDDGTFSIEAEGDGCLFHLRKVLWHGHPDYTDSDTQLLGWEWPPDPEWVRGSDPYADSGLAVPRRCPDLLGVRATVTDFDSTSRLLFIELTVTAETDEGDFRGEFDIWLACEYRGEAFGSVDQGQ